MKKSTFGEKVKELQIKLGYKDDQAGFGKLIGVRQSSVSEWVHNKPGRKPSAEACISLAKAALDPWDKLWFLEYAGIRKTELMSLAQRILADLGELPLEKDFLSVFPLAGSEERGVWRLPSNLPRLTPYTRYKVLDEHSSYPGFSAGDILFVDTFQRKESPLEPLWDKVVLVRTLHEGRDWFMSGRLGVWQAPDGWTALVLPLANEKGYALPWIGEWKPADKNPHTEQEARERIELYKHCAVIGRVIGWWNSSDGKMEAGQ